MPEELHFHLLFLSGQHWFPHMPDVPLREGATWKRQKQTQCIAPALSFPYTSEHEASPHLFSFFRIFMEYTDKCICKELLSFLLEEVPLLIWGNPTPLRSLWFFLPLTSHNFCIIPLSHYYKTPKAFTLCMFQENPEVAANSGDR